MAQQDVMPVSATTGTFATLEQVVKSKSVVGNVRTGTGNVRPDTGNNVPVGETARPNLAQLASQLNLASQSIGRDLRFRIDMKSGDAVIQVLDSETGELIREVPPEKANTYLSDSGLVELRLYDDLA